MQKIILERKKKQCCPGIPNSVETCVLPDFENRLYLSVISMLRGLFVQNIKLCKDSETYVGQFHEYLSLRLLKYM